MIQLTNFKGEKILVNIAIAHSMYPYNPKEDYDPNKECKTSIYFGPDDYDMVQESIEEIQLILSNSENVAVSQD